MKRAGEKERERKKNAEIRKRVIQFQRTQKSEIRRRREKKKKEEEEERREEEGQQEEKHKNKKEEKGADGGAEADEQDKRCPAHYVSTLHL